MTDLDRQLDEIRSTWVGEEFDIATFEVEPDRILTWANAVGETDPRFIDPDHPDFQAHPTFTTHLVTGRVVPEGFPRIGRTSVDGGKAVAIHQPVRPGETLTARATIADVYAKTGRSGTMVFVVQRTSFTDADDRPVAEVDWRMIWSGLEEG
ncbi:MAG: MaoC family dehydratase N-terminal domain-containing protein [Acidimicrobiales bacterium]